MIANAKTQKGDYPGFRSIFFRRDSAPGAIAHRQNTAFKFGLYFVAIVGPQVRRRRYALGWSQSDFATKLQIAGFDISRSGMPKIEARFSYVDDKTLLYLAELLKVPVQHLFPPHLPGNRPLLLLQVGSIVIAEKSSQRQVAHFG